MKIVAYMRVSTQQQGQSGLGLEAQRASIDSFARTREAQVIGVFTEIESGKVNTRFELAKALHLAKVTGATLVIAKLDRLSRNAAFLLALRDSGARFAAADMPDATDLTVGFMALMAQHEREQTSVRTREALAAARRRGVRLGNPNGANALRRAGKGNIASIAAIRESADRLALDLQPVLDSLANEGIKSLGAVAAALNERGMLTARGGRWHKASVRNLRNRLAAAS